MKKKAPKVDRSLAKVYVRLKHEGKLKDDGRSRKKTGKQTAECYKCGYTIRLRLDGALMRHKLWDQSGSYACSGSGVYRVTNLPTPRPDPTEQTAQAIYWKLREDHWVAPWDDDSIQQRTITQAIREELEKRG